MQTRTVKVTYTEALVRDAVKTFVWRRVVLGMKALWAAEIVLIALLIWLPRTGQDSWLTGVVSVVALLPPALVAAAWYAHHRNTVGKFRKMSTPQGEFTLLDDALEVASELGSSKIPWSGITEIWEKPAYWMIFIGPSQFMTLPTATVSSSDLAFIRTKVPPALVKKR